MSRFPLCLLLITTFSIVGCTPTPQSNPATAIIDDFTASVSVTGKLVPAVWTNVSAQTSGIVTQLMVTEGTNVEKGDILVKFDDQDAMITLKQAESALAVAQAQLTQINMKPRVEEIAVASAQVSAAQTAITQTIAQRAQLDAGSYSVQLAAAKAQVAAAQAERFVANQQHEDSMKCYDVKQSDGTSDRVCPTLGTIEEQTRMALQAADAALSSAETQLNMLYSEHRAQIQIADSGVLAANAQASVAEAQLALLKAEISPESVAVAEAMVEQAQISIDIAHLILERTNVRAPMAGVVGYISIREGEYIAQGTPLLIIGDLSTLRVETTDLDEIDVAQIDVGQRAVVTFEAIPDETFDSTVEYISPMAVPGGGGVNYTVNLTLATLHPKLRWGMTAFVDIATQE
jgi:multidrug efflux pump subunit AcrA (membrane-fusion protein)